MERVEASVRAFVTEYPNADYRAIVTRFGTPERIAESCVEEMEPGELLDGMRIREKMLLVVAATAAVLTIMRFVFLLAAYQDYLARANGYATVEIIVIEDIRYEEEPQ